MFTAGNHIKICLCQQTQLEHCPTAPTFRLELGLGSTDYYAIATAKGRAMSKLVPLDDDTAVPLNTTRAAEGLPRRRFTVAEIEAFVETGVIPEEERFELIGGEIVPMSPKGMTHERIKMWLNEQLVRNLPAQFATNPETTFRLADDTFLEPDFVVFERAAGLERLDGATCLLAIEIGLSSLSYDRGRKAEIYAAFGIRELWVIDGRRLETRVFREPGAEGYRVVSDVEAGEALEPLEVPGFMVRLAAFERFVG
ncbi:Uma2 family endonuclease [Aurantimonas endophytica]|uniref:Uma2 family endonuclease n=1 Tax=Aurantimonas endophytica TaxID=1522175 RepID=A0A7W6MQI7_9HYPH|nr:Uma2 family endonuclease [Aurantimonas endophytica]MBB4004110.1 Uma2 family endonuclease [Aurantimonas endophytica]